MKKVMDGCMKYLSLVLMFSIAVMFAACGDDSSVNNPSENKSLSTLTDSRDGQTYKTVTIGSQTWMAENLNFETADSYCYSIEPSYCAKYGRLYTWAAAKIACPTGWHLPTKAEYETLFSAVGGDSVASAKLKSTSGWSQEGNGTDDYLFSVLPAGFRYSRNAFFGNEGYEAHFWTSTEEDSDNAYYIYMFHLSDTAYLRNGSKNFGYSVRCVKD